MCVRGSAGTGCCRCNLGGPLRFLYAAAARSAYDGELLVLPHGTNVCAVAATALLLAAVPGTCGCPSSSVHTRLHRACSCHKRNISQVHLSLSPFQATLVTQRGEASRALRLESTTACEDPLNAITLQSAIVLQSTRRACSPIAGIAADCSSRWRAFILFVPVSHVWGLPLWWWAL